MHYLGVAGMPRRIPDYPDAFYIFNKISSMGSYVSAYSLIIFFFVFVDAFYNKPIVPKRKSTDWSIEEN